MLEKSRLNDGIFLYHKNLNNIIICALRAEIFEYAKKITQSYSEKNEPSFKNIFLGFQYGQIGIISTKL